MTDSERDLADCVGALYEAATGGGSWLDLGRRVCRVFDAQGAKLDVEGVDDLGLTNVLMPHDDGEAAYAAYFHRIDPYRARARIDFAEARRDHLGRARFGADLVPEQGFLKSEYFNDFARHHGRRHLIAGMAGVTQATPLSLFRGTGARPFGEREARLLQVLLPHVQAALELRMRLGRDRQSVRLTRAALDLLPFGVGIVDAGLKIHFLNDIARGLLAGPAAGLFAMRSGPSAGSGVYLAAASRDEAAALRRHVASATSGGAGASMRIGLRRGTMLALQVWPAPLGLAEDVAGVDQHAPAEPMAILLLRPLERKAAPSTEMLCELFGFSRAEAEVAAALSGGATAEEVARRRGVSLMTVRSQVRSILGKSDSDNLRDLERSMATLAALAPRQAVRG